VAELSLRVISGPVAGRSVELSGTVVAGRDPTLELVLDDEQVSRRHFQLELDASRVLLQDLDSSNGTYLNGQLATTTNRYRVRPGDRIQAGTTMLEVFSPSEQTSLAARVSPQLTAARAAEAPKNGILVEGLVREFQGGFRAVDGLDLEVHPGEIYGFLGPNGAGKSTTVHMLTTLLPPSGGLALVAGHDVSSEPARVRAAIGVALQEAALDPLLNAHEHMRLQCAMQKLPRSEWKARGEELIERVGLTEAAAGRVGRYSGGMKRRLDLALALVHRPRILFLDEPTTGLDPKSRGDLWDEVAHLARDEGVTVFLTTQYLEEADLLAGRIGIIDHGRLVAQGTPTQLKETIGRPTAEVTPLRQSDGPAIATALEDFGEPVASAKGAAVRLRGGAEELPAVVRALDRLGLPIANLELHQPTLDDVFLEQTGRSLANQAAEDGAGIVAGAPAPAAR
jgi:ABC-2 type transport system ATP-binding protein